MGFRWSEIDWRSRTLWQTVGYTLSAAWMLFVLVQTGGNVSHPLFDYIFIVPLVLWSAGLAIAWIVRKLLGSGKS